MVLYVADLMFRLAREKAKRTLKDNKIHCDFDIISNKSEISQFAPIEFLNTPHPFQMTNRVLSNFIK